MEVCFPVMVSTWKLDCSGDEGRDAVGLLLLWRFLNRFYMTPTAIDKKSLGANASQLNSSCFDVCPI